MCLCFLHISWQFHIISINMTEKCKHFGWGRFYLQRGCWRVLKTFVLSEFIKIRYRLYSYSVEHIFTSWMPSIHPYRSIGSTMVDVDTLLWHFAPSACIESIPLIWKINEIVSSFNADRVHYMKIASLILSNDILTTFRIIVNDWYIEYCIEPYGLFTQKTPKGVN